MNVDVSKLDEVMKRLKRKDKSSFKALQNKINQIVRLDKDAIEHFKNLKGYMKEYKRVHVGSFVLTFRVKGDIVIFESFKHHDEAYKR